MSARVLQKGLGIGSFNCSLQKSDHERIALNFFKTEQHSWFEQNALKKLVIRPKNTYFLYVFDHFPPFLSSKANCSRRSLLSSSFLKSVGSDSLSSLFTKEQPWAICSCCSWQKSDRSNSLFFTSESLFCSFALSLTKKRVIRWKTDEQISNPDYSRVGKNASPCSTEGWVKWSSDVVFRSTRSVGDLVAE